MKTDRYPEGLAAVAAACIPDPALGRLAPLRLQAGLEARVALGRAWLRWHPGDLDVLACVLPIPEVELFVRRAPCWYRLGSRLPAFEVDFETGMAPLERVLHPALPPAGLPEEEEIVPVPVRLVPSGRRQRTSAVLTTVGELAAWSEQVPAAALESLRALCCGAEVLLIGRPLPALAGARRLWGSSVLVPLGWRLEPDLPEKALRAALKIEETELLLCDQPGLEVLPGDAFEPLSRGGIKLSLCSPA